MYESTEVSSAGKAKDLTDNGMLDFLEFRELVTPLMLKILFFLGVVTLLLSGALVIRSAYSFRTGRWDDDPARVLTGIGIMVLGPVVLRIFCETIMVLFKIYRVLTEIRSRLDNIGFYPNGSQKNTK